MVINDGESFNGASRLCMAEEYRARSAKGISEQRVSLNADETFRAKLSIGMGIS